ncbi:hypothetical protein ILUMI_11380 [Ignelater luminosus]|uniref:DUF659 domain-containing protein n=1 Tax=Ignelater luminosus TaxID=2038154 RepID=A0A8K0G7S9_IGNLU|nr:hypothetical protein ILUMI_11380 [Ignelater luminosus]
MRSHLFSCVKVPNPIKLKLYTAEELKCKKGVSTASVASSSTNADNKSSYSESCSSVVCVDHKDRETPTVLKTSSSSIGSFVDVMKTSDQEQLTISLARAIYNSNTPLSIVENEHWKLYFKELRPSFVLPSQFLLSNRLLEDEYVKVKALVEEKVSLADNLALQCDGWSNLRNEGVEYIIITTSNPVFIKSVLTKTESNTAVYFKGILLNILEKYEPSKFMAVVTDNAKNMQKSTKLSQRKYPHLISYGCIAHTLHFIYKDILKLKSVDKIIDSTKMQSRPEPIAKFYMQQ